MSERPRNDGLDWTREQLVLALDLYCRIPWGSINHGNARVKELAAMIGRTPSSVARKLGNFGAFDPALQARNVGGLPHGSKLDRMVWDEFAHDWGRLAELAEAQRGAAEGDEAPLPEFDAGAVPHGPSERLVTTKQRLHQRFFREAVLSSYEHRCCISGLPVIETLVASHIRSWKMCVGEDEGRRADPTNGLCLSATFDRPFDRGLFALTDECKLVLSPRLARLAEKPSRRDPEGITGRFLQESGCVDGREIRFLPQRFRPDPVCLAWHRERVFVGG